MNSLARRRLGKTIGPGLIHMSVDSGIDDRDDFDYKAGEVPCCMASAMRGPRACTCWTPVYDMEQAPVAEGKAATRESCCFDCAYRNGSPERGDGYTDELTDLASDPLGRFACHQGMRRAVAWAHPDGRLLWAGEGDYKPPIIGDVAYKADGSPAELCAGWAAHRVGILSCGTHDDGAPVVPESDSASASKPSCSAGNE